MSWFLSTLFVLVSLAPTVDEPAPGAAKEAPSIPRLIEELGANEFNKREAAAQSLLNIGAPALEDLKAATNHKDLEVRRRVQDLVVKVEAAAVLSPKTVSIRLSKKTAREAVAEVARQTGYKLVVWPEATTLNKDAKQVVHDFQFGNLPFWEALGRICESGGLTIPPNNYGDDALRIHANDAHVPFACVRGPFRMVAERFDYGRNIQFGSVSRNPQAPNLVSGSEYLNFTLSLAVEPKLALLRVGNVRLLSAFDDQKHSLIPEPIGQDRTGFATSQRYYYGGGYRSYSQHIQASLAAPSRSARMVKVLRGTVPVSLLTKQEPLLVTDRLLEGKGKKVTVKETAFEIEDVAKSALGGHQIKLSIEDLDKKDPQEFGRIHSVYQRLEVHDAKGNKLQTLFNSIHTTNAHAAKVVFTCDPLPQPNPKLGPPAKLIFNTWSTMEHEVEFEFRDLPLP